jgi:type I restriction enzyme S subunit
VNSKWPVVPLGDILRRSTETTTICPDKAYREITVKLWGKGVVRRRVISGAEISGTRRFVARAGQVIVSRIDARNGALGLVPEDLDGAVVSNDFPLFDVNGARLEPTYLAWLTKTPEFVDLCNRASEGTTNRVRLQEGRFLSLAIRLPALDEQRRIARRIEDLVTKASELSRLRAKALQEIEALIPSLHLTQAGERVRSLGDVLELHEDVVPIIPGREYPHVGVRSFGGGLFLKPSVGSSDTSYRAFNRLFHSAVVLSQVKGWEGAIAVCSPTFAGRFVSPEYRTFRCIEGEALPGYLAGLIRTEWFWSRLQHATRGVGARRERTRPEQFLRLKLPMPDVAAQARTARIFAQLEATTVLHIEIITQLDPLVRSILDRAFKGEL